jgi:putative lipoprotein
MWNALSGRCSGNFRSHPAEGVVRSSAFHLQFACRADNIRVIRQNSKWRASGNNRSSMVRLGAVFVVFAALSSFGWGQASHQAATPAAASSQGTVSGNVVYRERIALPPDAAIEIKVQDISEPNAPTTIAETVFAPEGKQVPIPFQLSYNPADINPAHRYQIVANISLNGKPMFITKTPLWVITKGASSHADILLQQAPAQSAAEAGAKLTDTKWVLAEVNGTAALAGQGVSVHLELHKKGKVAGSTGCNNLVGSYIASEGALQFTLAATTMKMCTAPVMQQEQAVLAALKATTAYKLDGNTLELLNGSQSLAKFQVEGK